MSVLLWLFLTLVAAAATWSAPVPLDRLTDVEGALTVDAATPLRLDVRGDAGAVRVRDAEGAPVELRGHQGALLLPPHPTRRRLFVDHPVDVHVAVRHPDGRHRTAAWEDWERDTFASLRRADLGAVRAPPDRRAHRGSAADDRSRSTSGRSYRADLQRSSSVPPPGPG